MIDSLLEGLNPVQREAVLHGEGPLLVLAGAGSGKTRVVTARIARLLRDGVPPERILAVTFTNKAAAEMRARVEALLGGERQPGLTIATFHAFGARFLRQHAEALGRTRDFTIYDDDDQLAAVKKAMDYAGLPESGPLARAIAKSIDQARNRGLGAEASRLPEGPSGEVALARIDLSRVGAFYDEVLKQANAFDFGDLIRGPVAILEADAYVRDAWRHRFRHVLVDEFQDTNVAQHRLLHALAPPGSNLVVVGDDDQSIYGWRGAEVEHILRFPEEWGGRLLRLEQNYRSEGHILAAANGVISNNKKRLGKALWTDREAGARVELVGAGDPKEEARRVVGRMLDLRNEGFTPGDMAVLYRTNALSLDLEEALSRARLPYVVVRGRAFYDRAEIRNALSLLRLVMNPADDVALERAVNHVIEGVGKASFSQLEAHARSRGEGILASVPSAIEAGVVKGRARTGLQSLLTRLEATRTATALAPAAAQLFTEVGLLVPDIEVALLHKDAREDQENLRRLLQSLEETEGLAGFLEQVKLVADSDVRGVEGAVSLMTVHAAKGLEFPAVFVIGLEQGTFPSQRNLDPERIEEERRLFYVAVTRARRRLFLAHADYRRSFGQLPERRRPSLFLSEVPPAVRQGGRSFMPAPAITRDDGFRIEVDDHEDERPRKRSAPDLRFDDAPDDSDFRPGMAIWHADFGVGKVLRVRTGMETRLDIEFPDVGTRTVLARFVSPYEA